MALGKRGWLACELDVWAEIVDLAKIDVNLKCVPVDYSVGSLG